jgi:hypothetical protein
MCAGKSLGRQGWKQATFLAFYGTWRFITTFTRDHHLSLPLPNQSIPLLITLLTEAGCFLPGWAKDLSAPRYRHMPDINHYSLRTFSCMPVTVNLKIHQMKVAPIKKDKTSEFLLRLGKFHNFSLRCQRTP